MRLLFVMLIAAAIAAGCGGPGGSSEREGAAAVPVEVLVVAPETVSATVTTTGTLQARDDVPIVAEASGKVTDIPVRVGERVAAGDVLVSLDDELASFSYRQADAQWALAKTELEDAEDSLERALVLWESEDISEVEFEGAQRRFVAAEAAHDGALALLGTAERQLRNTRVSTPVAGWVAFVHAEVGHMVALGAPVAHVVNDAALQVDLGLSQDQVADVRSGRPVEVLVRAVPGRTFKGKVEYAGPRADDMTKTYPVRVVLQNSGRELKSGMVAEVTITTASFDDVVVIKRDWVLDRYGEPAVYVAADSVAVLRRLGLGKVIGDRVIVRSGLEPGDMLITLGLDNLSENARIDVKGGLDSESSESGAAGTDSEPGTEGTDSGPSAPDSKKTSGGDDR